jgi:hypothetical protein
MSKPVPFKHANALFQALKANADSDGFFEGSVTQLWMKLKISNSYYSPTFTALEKKGCIERIDRGSRNYGSKIAVKLAPTADDWNEVGGHLTTRAASARLSQRVEDIEQRLGGLDIGLALAELADEVRILKARIAQIAKDTHTQ